MIRFTRLAAAAAIVALMFGGSLAPRAAHAATIAAPLALPAVPPVMACAALQSARFADVDAPVHIAAAAATSDPQGNAYCKVEGYVEPAVRFEVHLPVTGWTQRYVQTGCGGLCGMLSVRLDAHIASCVPAANGELVIASTDMGHEGGNDGSWAAGNAQAQIDFAYRGVHVTAVVAKDLIAQYYGRAQRYAYFAGCSDGGREALLEAQRYPADFNGITAGAPALNFSVQNSFYHAWNALSNTDANGEAILTATRLPILHAAVLAACDAADGVKDGVIADPRRCKFDPASIQCRGGQDTTQCLSAAEVEAARRIYAGAHDAQGRKLLAGPVMPGSELNWSGVFVPRAAHERIFSAMIADGSVRNLYYADALPASWKLSDLKFDQQTLDGFNKRDIYDATNPDLSRFAKAGGRLLMWHGWADPHISALNSIAYYSAIRKTLGDATVASFARLFLFPGMGHCGGGEGPVNFDVLTPMMRWVESGVAPDVIVASHNTADDRQRMGSDSGPPPGAPPGGPSAMRGPPAAGEAATAAGTIDATRPVFAYPKLAQYTGSGSTADAVNFVAVNPVTVDPEVDWLGAKYMVPGRQQVCSAKGNGMSCKPAP